MHKEVYRYTTCLVYLYLIHSSDLWRKTEQKKSKLKMQKTIIIFFSEARLLKYFGRLLCVSIFYPFDFVCLWINLQVSIYPKFFYFRFQTDTSGLNTLPLKCLNCFDGDTSASDLPYPGYHLCPNSIIITRDLLTARSSIYFKLNNWPT